MSRATRLAVRSRRLRRKQSVRAIRWQRVALKMREGGETK